MTTTHPSQEVTKRTLDVLGSALGLLLLSPILAGVAVAVACALGRPVLFRQKRPGRNGRLFELVKFRSMRPPRTGREGAAWDGERLTRFGRLLRSTSLDELPTLWNVLRGDMSLVGPRPLLPEYLPRYNARQARRHEVRPGVTGWAQTNGRNAVSWEDRFEMDVWYVEHRSLALDLRILGRTIAKVWRREGISQPGQATACEFLGNAPEETLWQPGPDPARPQQNTSPAGGPTGEQRATAAPAVVSGDSGTPRASF